MHLATIEVEVQILPGFRSKRRTIRLILDKIHRHFNASIAELVSGPDPARSILGIATIAASRREVREVLDRVVHALAAHPRVEIIKVEWTDH